MPPGMCFPDSASGRHSPPKAIADNLDALWDEDEEDDELDGWLDFTLDHQSVRLNAPNAIPALESEKPIADVSDQPRKPGGTPPPPSKFRHQDKGRHVGCMKVESTIAKRSTQRSQKSQRPDSARAGGKHGPPIVVVFHDIAFQTQDFTSLERARPLIEQLRADYNTFAVVCEKQMLDTFVYNEEWRLKLHQFLIETGLLAEASQRSSSNPETCTMSRRALARRVRSLSTVHKKVIAYSLFGGMGGALGCNDLHHPAMEYIVGASLNCEKAKLYYPSWVVRIYYDQTMPTEILARLSNHSNLELFYVWNPYGGEEDEERKVKNLSTRSKALEPNYFGTMWRLLPFDDPTVDIFLSRDLDDVLNEEGRAYLEEWEASDASYAHRQSAEDRYLVNAGWFGMKRGAMPRGWSMKDHIAAWCLKHKDLAYCTDERFLSEVVWPAIGAGRGMALPHSRPGIDRLLERWAKFMQLPEAPVRPVNGITSWH